LIPYRKPFQKLSKTSVFGQKSVYNIVKLAVCGNVYLFLTNWYDKKLECDSCLDEFDEYDD